MSDEVNEFQVDLPPSPLPELSDQQARVFACLIEKHLATPNSYPLTINSLQTACNQKTNRQPIMSLTEGEVERNSNQLVELDLARIDHGSRAKKISHIAMRTLDMSREEIAVLSILILREPLTINEIKMRTEKMVGFESIVKAQETVDGLLDRTYSPLVLLPKGAGRREDRYSHTLCGEVDVEAFTFTESTAPRQTAAVDNAMVERIDALESRVAQLEQMLEELTA